MTKKIVYTAIVGNYDKLIPIRAEYRKGWELRCFVDQVNFKSDIWKIIEVARCGLSNLALARKIKILSNSFVRDGDISLWIDASMEVIASLNDYAALFPKEDFVAVSHPDRKCTYDEMDACIVHKRAYPEKIDIQRKKYLEMGFPRNYGLIESQVLLRKNNPQITALNNLWWQLLVEFETWRDQVTLPLALWKLQYVPQIIPWDLKSKFFIQKKIHKGIYK